MSYRFAIIVNGQPVEIETGKVFVCGGGFQHPANWFDLYFQYDLDRYNILPIEEASPAPEGQTITGKSLSLVDGNVVEYATYSPVVIEVPERISMMQARMVLLNAGLLDEVQTFVASAPTAVQIYWEYASHIHRDHEVVVAIGEELSLNSDALDALFIAGALIV